LDGIERCIDDEIPFEIPETWEWCRLKTVGITQTGNTPSKAHPDNFSVALEQTATSISLSQWIPDNSSVHAA
jgi:hypothetical protein